LYSYVHHYECASHYQYHSFNIYADLDDFPRMQRAGSESPSDYRKRRYDYHHDSEIVFALPSLQLQLRTKHHQADTEPIEDGEIITLKINKVITLIKYKVIKILLQNY